MSLSRRLTVIAAGLVLGAACSAPPPPAPAPAPAPAVPAMSQVERGKYIVTAGFCNDCHTPWKVGANGPEPDMTRLLSGHPESIKVTMPKIPAGWGYVGSPTSTAWAGPWGVSFTANLTPDQNTGLGVWDEAMFIAAMREGKHMGKGRPILPPMPWPWVGKYSDDDLKAIFAYLKSIPAISNRVPDPIAPVN
jgi:cytochrome c553